MIFCLGATAVSTRCRLPTSPPGTRVATAYKITGIGHQNDDRCARTSTLSMHLCKLVILLATASSFGIFLGQQSQPTTFSTPSASAKSTTTTSSSDNLNNFYLEDAKQDLDWTTADASDEKIGLTSFPIDQAHQDTPSSASARFHRLLENSENRWPSARVYQAAVLVFGILICK